MDMFQSGLQPVDLQQAHLDFKKIVDKYFSPEAYATGVFDSTDMANAIEEMTTVGQKLARIKKDREDESSRSNADGIQLCPTCGKAS